MVKLIIHSNLTFLGQSNRYYCTHIIGNRATLCILRWDKRKHFSMGNKIIHFNGSLFLPRNETDKVTATFYLKIWKKTSELWQKVRITLSIFNNVAETENFLAIMGSHLTILNFFPPSKLQEKSLNCEIKLCNYLFYFSIWQKWGSIHWVNQT